jgi:hypothetical protein
LPILVTDETIPAGGHELCDATRFNMESFFGWSVKSEELRAALSARKGQAARVDG